MTGRVRLADVARRAGVSLGTASNAFSRPEKVRPELRERIAAVGREMGYAGPDPKGRVLMGGKVNAIGVLTATRIMRTFDDVYLRRFMSGVAEVCDELGAGLVLISAEDEELAARALRTALVDGLVLHNRQHMAGLIELAKARRLPFVAVNSDPDPLVNTISVDSRGGARAAARHLLGLGHRRFAILSFLTQSEGAPLYHPPADQPRRLTKTFIDTRERWLGYGEALAEAGISIDRMPAVEALLPAESPSDGGARMLLDAAPDATAVLAMSDGQAFAVIAEAHRRGLRVPQDLSVVGFDDVPEAAASEPPLTTIAQPIMEKGRAAARAILEPPEKPQNEVLPVTLVVRGSSGPPPR